MLKTDGGEYACIAEDPARYNLGDVKEEMQAAMGLNTEVGVGAEGLRPLGRDGLLNRRFQLSFIHSSCDL